MNVLNVVYKFCSVTVNILHLLDKCLSKRLKHPVLSAAVVALKVKHMHICHRNVLTLTLWPGWWSLSWLESHAPPHRSSHPQQARESGTRSARPWRYRLRRTKKEREQGQLSFIKPSPGRRTESLFIRLCGKSFDPNCTFLWFKKSHESRNS